VKPIDAYDLVSALRREGTDQAVDQLGVRHSPAGDQEITGGDGIPNDRHGSDENVNSFVAILAANIADDWCVTETMACSYYLT